MFVVGITTVCFFLFFSSILFLTIFFVYLCMYFTMKEGDSLCDWLYSIQIIETEREREERSSRSNQVVIIVVVIVTHHCILLWLHKRRVKKRDLGNISECPGWKTDTTSLVKKFDSLFMIIFDCWKEMHQMVSFISLSISHIEQIRYKYALIHIKKILL